MTLPACHSGTATDPPAPVPVRLVAGVGAVCAIMSDATIRCWGENRFGQLIPHGGSTAVDAPHATVDFPTQLPGLADVRDFSNGQDHSCAIVGDEGRLSCRGSNGFYQLGVDDISHGVVEVSGVPPAVQVQLCGQCTTMLDRDGAVWYWGSCTDLLEASPEKRRVAFSQRFISIRNLGCVQCGITEAHEVWCWGSNFEGAFGDGKSDDTPVNHAPTRVPGLTGVVQLAPTCAVDSAHRVYCWGMNNSGQLGQGTVGTLFDPPQPPLQVAQLRATQVERAANAACALEVDGHVSCWGTGYKGVLGNGPPKGQNPSGNAYPDDSPVPRRVKGVANVIGLAVGWGEFACVLLADHSVKCWGDNECSEVGVGPDPLGYRYEPFPRDVRF